MLFLELSQPDADKQVIFPGEFMHFLTSVGVVVKQKQLDNLIKCNEFRLRSNYEITTGFELHEEFFKNKIGYFKPRLRMGIFISATGFTLVARSLSTGVVEILCLCKFLTRNGCH